MGLWLDAGVTKKLTKRWSLDVGAEYRMKDNLNQSDRIGLGIGTSYRIAKWLKVSAGYDFLYSYHPSESELNSSGKKQKNYEAYWYPRHRVHIGLTGQLKVDRWRFSLRERWVYTYKPEVTVNGTKTKLSSGAVEPDTKIREGGCENVLRSRAMAEYDIKGYPISPFASIEAYNAWKLQKVRYSVGAEWDITKHHSVKLYYLFQDRRQDNSDDDEIDSHILGLSYNFSF